jgi:hypothetical protein
VRAWRIIGRKGREGLFGYRAFRGPQRPVSGTLVLFFFSVVLCAFSVVLCVTVFFNTSSHSASSLRSLRPCIKKQPKSQEPRTKSQDNSHNSLLPTCIILRLTTNWLFYSLLGTRYSLLILLWTVVCGLMTFPAFGYRPWTIDNRPINLHLSAHSASSLRSQRHCIKKKHNSQEPRTKSQDNSHKSLLPTCIILRLTTNWVFYSLLGTRY